MRYGEDQVVFDAVDKYFGLTFWFSGSLSLFCQTVEWVGYISWGFSLKSLEVILQKDNKIEVEITVLII